MTVCPVLETVSTLTSYGKATVGQGRGKKAAQLYYEIHGNGPEKVVMLSGLCTPCQYWGLQYEYLAKTGEYTVLVFDNRGMGRSDSPLELYTIPEMAYDTLDLLEYLGWTSTAHLVGISMGGMIALELATREPKRWKTIMLTSTNSRNRVPTVKTAITVGKVVMAKTDSEKIESAIDLAYPSKWLKLECDDKNFPTNRDWLSCMMHRWLGSSLEQPVHGLIGQTAACMRHYVPKKRLLVLRRTGVPITIVTGTMDGVILPHYSYKLHVVLGGRLEVFVGSGHGIPQEQRERYNQLLIEHFTQSDA